MTSFLIITFILSLTRILNAQTTVDIVEQNYPNNAKSAQTLNLEGLDYLLRFANSMFDKNANSQSSGVSTLRQIEPESVVNQKLLPPYNSDNGYYMPLYMTYENDKIDGKNKHLIKISPPEKSNEPNYYSVKPKKIPKKYSSTVKHVNIKREAIPNRKQSKGEISTTTTVLPQERSQFVMPKMYYNDWIPIVGNNHKNSRGNYDVVYGTYDSADSHPAVPERDNNEEDNIDQPKSKTKKTRSRSRRDVYDILSRNERINYQMHGFGGPKTYKFGYDTGKGKDRHFRFEERKNDGSVKGEYGFVDDQGKLSVVRYSANSETGFQVEH